jgi:hypothetical protein
MKKTNNTLKKFHLLVSIIPLLSFVVFLTYIFRVVIELGMLPKFHKQASFSYIHNEIVWVFLITGYLSPIIWVILTLILKSKNIKIKKIRIVIWLIGISILYLYLLFIDPYNLLGWFVD